MPCEERPIGPASSSARSLSPTGIAIRSNQPAHRKPPWTGYKQSLRFLTQLITAHPLTGICRPPNLTTAESNRLAEQLGEAYDPRAQCRVRIPQLHRHNRACSRGFPFQHMTQPKRSRKRQLHLIHHAEDTLVCMEPVVLVVKLAGHHSYGADRLPVAVRFPAGPRVRLNRRPAERQRARTKKMLVCMEPIQGWHSATPTIWFQDHLCH